MGKVAINKIVIEIGKRKIELTKNQAKEMKEVLDELFGEKVVVDKEYHYHGYRDYYPYWKWDGHAVLCSDNSAKLTLDNNTVNCCLSSVNDTVGMNND